LRTRRKISSWIAAISMAVLGIDRIDTPWVYTMVLRTTLMANVESVDMVGHNITKEMVY